MAGEPDTVLQVQGFVMCWTLSIFFNFAMAQDGSVAPNMDKGIAFHPTKPSILAGGTYNGELQIW